MPMRISPADADAEYGAASRRRAFRVAEVRVQPEPLLGGARPDYADCFEVTLDVPDSHPAEEWVRVALDETPQPGPALIGLVHRHVIRFRLGPAFDEQHILGWRVVHSSQDVMQMEASGPLVRGMIVARRRTPTRVTLTTFVFYRRPLPARLMFVGIRPIHKRAAARLVGRAARAFTAPAPATTR